MKFIKLKRKNLIELTWNSRKEPDFSVFEKSIRFKKLEHAIVKVKALIRAEELPRFQKLMKQIEKECSLLLTPLPIIIEEVRRRDDEQKLELSREEAFKHFVETKKPKRKSKILKKGLAIINEN